MRLAAIYIPKGKLDYIFGEEHKGQTINLGGNCIYKFVEVKGQLNITSSENTDFISDFWGEKISLVSSFVGANGSGKTSILRMLIKESSSKSNLRDCILIYEEGDEFHVLNESKFEISGIKTSQKIERNDLKEKFLYYSPNLDYNLQDLKSPISLANYHKKNLHNYHLGNLLRHLFLLNNEELINTLRKTYSDFPFYEEIFISPKMLYKSDFEQVYIQSTLGNKLYRIRNNLLSKTDNHKTINLNQNQIKKIFEGNNTIQDELQDLWDTYKNKNQDESQFLHDNSNFFKDLEVNLLSFLVINDYFDINGDNGNYPFEQVLNAESFEQKLDNFLEKYIVQHSNLIYSELKSDNVGISTSNLKKLKKELNNRLSLKFQGVADKTKVERILGKIDLVESVYNFYNSLKSITKSFPISVDKSGFLIKIKEINLKEFSDFIATYENLLQQIKYIDLDAVLEIKSSKKLSTGENSLIDMYASIYDYLKRHNGQEHMYEENCILLLDEPEQGYHPVWKKKFIKAIISTLPVLFGVNSIVKNLQIIFTTHDPLTLSDIPQSNVTYLNKSEAGLTQINQSKLNSFGANIHDLLAQSFFLDDGLIGEFANDKINGVIDWIDNNKEEDNRTDNFKDELERNKKVIELIDEKIIKIKLAEMINDLVPDEEFQNKIIENEIEYLKSKKTP